MIAVGGIALVQADTPAAPLSPCCPFFLPAGSDVCVGSSCVSLSVVLLLNLSWPQPISVSLCCSAVFVLCLTALLQRWGGHGIQRPPLLVLVPMPLQQLLLFVLLLQPRPGLSHRLRGRANGRCGCRRGFRGQLAAAAATSVVCCLNRKDVCGCCNRAALLLLLLLLNACRNSKG